VRASFLLRILLALAPIMLTQSASAQQNDIATLNQQAIRLFQTGQKTEAIALAEKSVEMARTSLGADNKITAILLSQLGNFYRDVGRFADAERALKAAIPMLERTGTGANFDLAAA